MSKSERVNLHAVAWYIQSNFVYKLLMHKPTFHEQRNWLEQTHTGIKTSRMTYNI